MINNLPEEILTSKISYLLNAVNHLACCSKLLALNNRANAYIAPCLVVKFPFRVSSLKKKNTFDQVSGKQHLNTEFDIYFMYEIVLTNSTLLWQKEASDKSDISCKEQNVSVISADINGIS